MIDKALTKSDVPPQPNGKIRGIYIFSSTLLNSVL